MNNVNDTYFDGYYKDIWRALIPEELTSKEVDFIISNFQLTAENLVIDLMCGYGRHAIALAKRGVNVIAVDNLADYIDEIRNISRRDSIPIEAVLANVADFRPEVQADLIMCMGNSICFFNEIETKKIYKNLSESLKIGGHVLINTWTLAEITFNNFQQRVWSQVGNVKFLVESRYHLQPSRLESKHYIIQDSGEVEEKESIDYIYSLSETERMLLEANLAITDVYSIPGRKKFTLNEPRAYIIAKKTR